MSIPFLDLKSINLRSKKAFLEASNRVLDSGWFVLGHETKMFESEFSAYCESDHEIREGEYKLVVSSWQNANEPYILILDCKDEGYKVNGV